MRRHPSALAFASGLGLSAACFVGCGTPTEGPVAPPSAAVSTDSGPDAAGAPTPVPRQPGNAASGVRVRTGPQ